MAENAQIYILEKNEPLFLRIKLDCIRILLDRACNPNVKNGGEWMTSIQLFNELGVETSQRINSITETYEKGGLTAPESFVGAACAHASRNDFPRLEHDPNHFPNKPSEEQDAFRIRL